MAQVHNEYEGDAQGAIGKGEIYGESAINYTKISCGATACSNALRTRFASTYITYLQEQVTPIPGEGNNSLSSQEKYIISKGIQYETGPVFGLLRALLRTCSG